ncbi:MAG: ATP-grasp domain-containing protein [Patescibacteria group bacterium]
MKTLRKILVLYNKPENINDESDLDTQNSAFEVAKQLTGEGFRCEVMGIGLGEIDKVKKLNADLIFNMVEWTGNNIKQGTQVIKILEQKKLPFTGSGARGFLLSSDKVWMKEEMIKNNIPIPGQKFPMIVKPAYEHCGIGITQTSIVKNENELRIKSEELRKKYNQPVIAEEFIEGRELHVTVLEKNGRPWVLPPAEVIFHKPGTVLSYEMKWNKKSPEYTQAHMEPAKLDKSLELIVERIAKKAYVKLGGRDYPRLDMRVRGDEVYVLEINNNPGVDFNTDAGMGVSARLAGFKTYGELLKHIVENAYLRFASQHDAHFL